MHRWGLTVQQVQDRVAARFPQAEPLPGRPELDTVLEEAEAGIEWHGESQRYVIVESGGTPTTGWLPSSSTRYSSPSQVDLDVDELERTLRRLSTEGGFVAATVDGKQLTVAARRLADRLNAPLVDVDADAAEPTSQKFSRLKLLVERAAAEVKERLRQTGERAVAINLGLLARYKQMGLIDELNDELTHSDQGPQGMLRGLLVLVPEAGDSSRPEVDGTPIPVVTAGQTIHVPSAWLKRAAAA